ncbi:MAG: hypothetical protein II551_06445 [Paludibacteraceae bacterium]|nr:hypothetical protein [Paludibacteraceae bacterium]
MALDWDVSGRWSRDGKAGMPMIAANRSRKWLKTGEDYLQEQGKKFAGKNFKKGKKSAFFEII